MTGSRLLGTVYHNTSINPIFVVATSYNSNSAAIAKAYTDSSSSPSTEVAEYNAPEDQYRIAAFWVLAGNYYEITDTDSGTATLYLWTEWTPNGSAGPTGPTGPTGAAGVGGAMVLPNDSSTGTSVTYLATVNVAGNAIKATTGSTNVPVFICISSCGTIGNATLAAMGTATCQMDAGGAVIQHFIQASTSVAGACSDVGATPPQSGWVIGQAASTAAANATATIALSQGYSSGGGAASLYTTYALLAGTTCNSSNNGQVGFTSDSVYTARCNGSAWQWFFRGMAVTPPPASGWSLDAQTGSTVTANADGTVTFYFVQQNSTNCCLDVAYRTGTATQTVTALYCSDFGNMVSGDPGLGVDVSDALGVRDSTDATEAHYFTSAAYPAPGTAPTPTYYTTVDLWTNRTTYSSTPTTYPSNYPPDSGPALAKAVLQDCRWQRVVEDASNIYFYQNYPGTASGWILFYSASKTAFLASGTHNPSVIGYVNGNSQNITLISWTATNP